MNGSLILDLYNRSDKVVEKSFYLNKSTTGYFLKMAGGIFSCKSYSQKTVALSSTEAEYMALSDCSQQCFWVQQLLGELRINIPTMTICRDNQGSLFIAQNPITEKRSKHIDIRYHYICELIEQKRIALEFISGENNPADMFTKAIDLPRLKIFNWYINLHFFSAPNPKRALTPYWTPPRLPQSWSCVDLVAMYTKPPLLSL